MERMTHADGCFRLYAALSSVASQTRRDAVKQTKAGCASWSGGRAYMPTEAATQPPTSKAFLLLSRILLVTCCLRVRGLLRSIGGWMLRARPPEEGG